MSFDYGQSGRRHYDDAERLANLGRYDNAGHLMGLAAECILKEAVGRYASPRDREITGHLPRVLGSIIRKLIRSRSREAQTLLLALSGGFQGAWQDWRIDHRYAPDNTVDASRYSVWHRQTKRILGFAKSR